MPRTYLDMTVGELRSQNRKGLKLRCTRCGYENTVLMENIPTSRDPYPLKMLSYPHQSCPARGAGLVRVMVV